VFNQSFKNGLLIKQDDIIKAGVKYFNYRSLIIYDKGDLPDEVESFLSFANIGLNLYKSCINLRTGPSTEYDIIKCLKSNDWDDNGMTKMRIIENQGNWVKIEAETFSWDGGECGFIKDKDWKGWIKAFDDIDKPNIWYSITSY